MKLFRLDGGLYQGLTRLADVIIINFIFLIACLPVFTMGASFTALYSVTLKLIGQEETYVIRDFLKSFRTNFFQSTKMLGLVITLFAGLLGVFKLIDTTFIIKYPFLIILTILLFVCLYVFPLLARFKMNNKDTLKWAFYMSSKNVAATIVMFVIVGGGTFVLPVLFPQAFVLWLTIGIAGPAYISSHFITRTFSKYDGGL